MSQLEVKPKAVKVISPPPEKASGSQGGKASARGNSKEERQAAIAKLKRDVERQEALLSEENSGGEFEDELDREEAELRQKLRELEERKKSKAGDHHPQSRRGVSDGSGGRGRRDSKGKGSAGRDASRSKDPVDSPRGAKPSAKHSHSADSSSTTSTSARTAATAGRRVDDGEREKTVSGPSASSLKLHALEAMAAELRERLARETEAKTKHADLIAERDRIKAELERASRSRPAAPSASMARVAELEREKAMLHSKLRDMESGSSLSSKMREAATVAQQKLFGVEICFILDCTGSMGSWIRTASQKILDIMKAAKAIDVRAIPRVAFIGYRDFCGRTASNTCTCPECTTRIVLYDFVGLNEAGTMSSAVSTVAATGGGDGPEDIAGALNTAARLKWETSTRLVIHIADAPCHGNKYHGGQGDSYPAGDPTGLIPEECLRELMNKSVNYYFGKINSSTDQMLQIFRSVFESSGKAFNVIDLGSDVSKFLPSVVESVRDSMSRSIAFSAGTARSASRASASTLHSQQHEILISLALS